MRAACLFLDLVKALKRAPYFCFFIYLFIYLFIFAMELWMVEAVHDVLFLVMVHTHSREQALEAAEARDTISRPSPPSNLDGH